MKALLLVVLLPLSCAASVLPLARTTVRPGVTCYDSYKAQVMALSPIAYWPMDDGNSTIVNAEGTAARNGSYSSATYRWGYDAIPFWAPRFDRTNTYGNVFSASLAGAFSGQLGSMVVTVAYDPMLFDANFQRYVFLAADANNRISIYKNDNPRERVYYLYHAGGTQLTMTNILADTNLFRPFTAAMTWSLAANEYVAYLQGRATSTNVPALGTFAGSLTGAWIGCTTNGPSVTRPFGGILSQVALFPSMLTTGQVATLSLCNHDQYIVRVTRTMTVKAMRDLIIRQIWSGNGLPTAGATAVGTGLTDPLIADGLSPANLLRFDHLTNVLDNNSGTPIWTNVCNVWRPTVATSINKAVIYHDGHTASDASYGLPDGQGDMIKALVEAGYTVVGPHMPFGGATSADTVNNHKALPYPTSSTLNYLKFFAEPCIRAINQLAPEGFTEWFMCGLSGGGWTTHLVSAIDTRIGCSAPVAGAMPWYMGYDQAWYTGIDFEQFLPGLWWFCDYPDLMVLAADNGRTQVQYLNTGDTCCFDQTAYNAHTHYDPEVAAVTTASGGSYSLVWDTNAAHSISATTRAAILTLFNGFSR